MWGLWKCLSNGVWAFTCPLRIGQRSLQRRFKSKEKILIILFDLMPLHSASIFVWDIRQTFQRVHRNVHWKRAKGGNFVNRLIIRWVYLKIGWEIKRIVNKRLCLKGPITNPGLQYCCQPFTIYLSDLMFHLLVSELG